MMPNTQSASRSAATASSRPAPTSATIDVVFEDSRARKREIFGDFEPELAAAYERERASSETGPRPVLAVGSLSGPRQLGSLAKTIARPDAPVSSYAT